MHREALSRRHQRSPGSAVRYLQYFVPGGDPPRIVDVVGFGDEPPRAGILIFLARQVAQRLTHASASRVLLTVAGLPWGFAELFLDCPGLAEADIQLGPQRNP